MIQLSQASCDPVKPPKWSYDPTPKKIYAGPRVFAGVAIQQMPDTNPQDMVLLQFTVAKVADG